MTQTKIRLTSGQTKRNVPVFAEAIGLTCEDEMLTLRFMGNVNWGEQARQVRIDKKLAEQLLRLLNDELEDSAWSF
jgi:hypothetical protein